MFQASADLLIPGLDVAGDASDLALFLAAGLAALILPVVGFLVGVVAVDAVVAELPRMEILEQCEARSLAVLRLVRVVPAVVLPVAVFRLGHAPVVLAPAEKLLQLQWGTYNGQMGVLLLFGFHCIRQPKLDKLRSLHRSFFDLRSFASK